MKSPPGDECTVAHVSLLYLVAFLDADGLSEQTVHQICIILCLVGFCVGKESQFLQLPKGQATAIKGVETSENATVVARYAADGSEISAPVKGINILKLSDGTTRKVVVK